MSAPVGMLPAGPLLAALGRHVADPDYIWRVDSIGRRRTRSNPTEPSAAQLAAAAGVARRTIARWRAGGHLDVYDADRIACRIGLHPASVWPEWFTVDVGPRRGRRREVVPT